MIAFRISGSGSRVAVFISQLPAAPEADETFVKTFASIKTDADIPALAGLARIHAHPLGTHTKRTRREIENHVH
jgi:hypothetical protein